MYMIYRVKDVHLQNADVQQKYKYVLIWNRMMHFVDYSWNVDQLTYHTTPPNIIKSLDMCSMGWHAFRYITIY